MDIRQIQAIDVHGHYGFYRHGRFELKNEFMSATAEEVVRLSLKAAIGVTVVSPMEAFSKGSAVNANVDAARIVQEHASLYQWVVINPLLPDTYTQADEMLKNPKCLGIKIHPELNNFPITKHGDKIFEFAAERSAVVLTHSGEKQSMPEDFLVFAERYPEATILLAHLGLGWDGDYTHHIRSIQGNTHNNLYVDTSSANSITTQLIEFAVKEIGADKILFGSDTPLYFAAMQRARIDYADISDEQKLLILRENAVKLLAI